MKLTERFKKGSLLKDSTLVITSSLMASVFNYLFQLYVGRALGPVDYGIFGAVVSLLYILSVPSMTIQTTITKFVSEFKAKGEENKISTLLIVSIKRISLYSLAAFLIFSISSGEIASFLRIQSRSPVILLGLILIVGSVLPITLGALMGFQRFWVYNSSSVLGALLKLFFGGLFIYVGFGVNGALFSLALSSLIIFFISLIFLRAVFQQPGGHIEGKDIYTYSAPVLVAVLLFTALSNVDVILVKHFFSPVEAGYYAAASLLGKVIFFLAGPISFVMFPKASEKYTLKKRSVLLLRDSLFYTLMISLFGVMAYFISPFFIVSSLFGSEFLAVVPFIGLFGIAMAFYSMINVIVMFDMAIKNMRFLPFLAFAVLLEFALIILFHHDLYTVIKIITLTMISLFTMLLLINKKELLG